MAWILTIDLDVDDSASLDELSEQLWTLGSNGIAQVDGVDTTTRLLAGFETETATLRAAEAVGGAVSPVDPSAWEGPGPTSVEVGGHTLTIDAGKSFGHGEHPTTRLCLDLLVQTLEPDQAVLDVGCGSGVLALAAAAVGAGVISAIDIDQEAVAAATRNAESNGLPIVVSDTPITDVTGPFDLVMVNMLVAELEPIAEDVRRLATGALILSGALVHQAERWETLFPDHRLVDRLISDEWAGQLMRHV